MMRTKEKYEELRGRFQERASEERISTKAWRRATRMVKLVDILHGLGFGPDLDDQYYRVCVDYRGYRYLWGMNDDIITVFAEVGTYETPMEQEVWAALGAVINATLSSEMLVSIFYEEGVINIYSEQYLGKRELDEDEVMYMLKNISDATWNFLADIKEQEELKGYVVCR